MNTTLRSALPELCRGYQVIHVCGPGKLSDQHEHIANYIQIEYVDELWGDVLALAEIVISRAGANSLYELLCLRKPHVLVPLSKVASRGDQVENALMSKEQGWSDVIFEEELNAQRLCAVISNLHQSRNEYQQRMEQFERLDSAKMIEEILSRAANERNS